MNCGGMAQAIRSELRKSLGGLKPNEDQVRSSEGTVTNRISLWLKHWNLTQQSIAIAPSGLDPVTVCFVLRLTPTATCFRRSTAPFILFEPSFRITKSTLFQIVFTLHNSLCVTSEMSIIEMVIWVPLSLKLQLQIV